MGHGRKPRRKKMERGCIDENVRLFTQANQTPSLQNDVIEMFGWTGNSNIADDILNGTAILPQLDQCIRELLPFLKTPEAIQQKGNISTIITTEDYVYHWKKTREYTSSGKSGLHFGHFKASCRSRTLVEVDRLMLEIPFRTGYSPRRWKVGIDCMIPKKVDFLQVTNLCTILLFEADCNHLFKIFGRRMMLHAEQAMTISTEQYGSRKRKSSIMHATNKQLVFDTIRQCKLNATLLVLDAKSCYDRISPPKASL
jgi:hypothetical protein